MEMHLLRRQSEHLAFGDGNPVEDRHGFFFHPGGKPTSRDQFLDLRIVPAMSMFVVMVMSLVFMRMTVMRMFMIMVVLVVCMFVLMSMFVVMFVPMLMRMSVRMGMFDAAGVGMLVRVFVG